MSDAPYNASKEGATKSIRQTKDKKRKCKCLVSERKDRQVALYIHHGRRTPTKQLFIPSSPPKQQQQQKQPTEKRTDNQGANRYTAGWRGITTVYGPIRRRDGLSAPPKYIRTPRGRRREKDGRDQFGAAAADSEIRGGPSTRRRDRPWHGGGASAGARKARRRTRGDADS